MSGFRVIARTAGTESSAKTMSVVSMTTSATKSGVATSRPRSRRQKSWPWSTGLTRTTRAIHVSHTSQAACTTFRSRSAPKSMRHAANSKSADADTLEHSPPPSTGVLGSVRVLSVRPFCDECAAEELYIATPHRMIVASYSIDVGTPGFHEAQEHFYRALVSTLRPTD